MPGTRHAGNRLLIYDRKDLSPCWQWNETQCKSLARRYGYRGPHHLVTARDDTRMYRLLHECRCHECEAIFVPDLDHLGEK